ncbi:hypothetical protein EJ04DRAFT_337236 [Polyplosphaeria fusca]|uniref:Uncharacterized protein n=1 Tax=Polyplosphaeria fusca TaxID=682080 RepID=A0A9P4V0W3_9PLEO|nr:hypothetical protein EJ04DRAFT_337236 [Polyplosphaeria fusca]
MDCMLNQLPAPPKHMARFAHAFNKRALYALDKLTAFHTILHHHKYLHSSSPTGYRGACVPNPVSHLMFHHIPLIRLEYRNPISHLSRQLSPLQHVIASRHFTDLNPYTFEYYSSPIPVAEKKDCGAERSKQTAYSPPRSRPYPASPGTHERRARDMLRATHQFTPYSVRKQDRFSANLLCLNLFTRRASKPNSKFVILQRSEKRLPFAHSCTDDFLVCAPLRYTK